MLRSLTFFVLVFGIVCTLIGAAHMVLGPGIIPGGIPVPPAMDSEDRFFGTLFIGFGLANVWCSRDIVGRGNVFLALMAIFFLGGIARIISLWQVGWPGGFIAMLGALELAIPPICWAMLRAASKPAPER